MKILDITVLFVGTITSKIYLAMLKKNSLLPKKIIHLKYENSDSYQRSQGDIDNKLADIILNASELNRKDIEFDIQIFPSEYTSITIKSLEDIHLKQFLQQEKCKTFLYTGGGILKRELLSLENSKFIHIHPGVLPDIRGADGILWSYLIKQKAGYSCFYMDEGIDTGHILHIEEFPIHGFDNTQLAQYDLNIIYKALLQYYDPILRSKTLINLLKKTITNKHKLNDLPFTQQKKDEGRSYFFMHEELRNYTIKKMIKI